jgi:hypothetical protein
MQHGRHSEAEVLFRRMARNNGAVVDDTFEAVFALLKEKSGHQQNEKHDER